jgi:hypothetical protein
MLRKLAAAAIAVSLIAGSAFAQGNAPVTGNPPAAKTTTGVKIKETGAVTVKTRKHVSLNVRHRHHVRHLVHVKPAKHVVHAKHFKQVKRINQPAKNKISG